MPAFCFIDEVVEVKKGESLTAFYTLTGDEEFLKDHFEEFPVMPGVLLIESVKQAAIALTRLSLEKQSQDYRLSSVEEARFGQFVKPGSKLKIFVRWIKKEPKLNTFESRIDLLNEPFGRVLMADLSLVPVHAI